MNVTLEIKREQNGFVVKQDNKIFVHEIANGILTRVVSALTEDFDSLKTGDSYIISIQSERK